jgi:aldose sugar dehydrogenase
MFVSRQMEMYTYQPATATGTPPKPGDDKFIKVYKKTTLNKTQLKLNKGVSPKLLTANMTISKGAALYTNYCAACHKPNRAGLQNTFPPLVASTIVSRNKSILIKLVLNGRTGPLSVNGQTYNQEMPSFKFMNDNDPASILTYVRSNFSNLASAVRAYEIAKYRASEDK